MDIDAIQNRIEVCRSLIDHTTSILDEMTDNEEGFDESKAVELLKEMDSVIEELEKLISLIE